MLRKKVGVGTERTRKADQGSRVDKAQPDDTPLSLPVLREEEEEKNSANARSTSSTWLKKKI